MESPSRPVVTRRVFLGATAAGLASVIHRPAFAQPVAPSDQIRLALIGVGGMGTGRLTEFMKEPGVRIAAICDVDGRHRDAAIARVQTTLGYAPRGEGDFRRVLLDKNVDAVAIQTPDHWHAIAAVRAMEAGKDVFVEKPLSYSVAEGRAMADASSRYARVTQMGNHIHNTGRNYRNVVELVQSGSLGRITRVQCWRTWDRPLTNEEPASKPAELDYDFWLGPAPARPYTPLRSHRTFRNFWDYSGGTFIDFWCHIMDVAVWALDLGAPRSVSAMGGRFFNTDTTETPDTLDAMLEYERLLVSFSLRPAPPAGFTHMGGIGCVFEGTEATLVTNYGSNEVWVKGNSCRTSRGRLRRSPTHRATCASSSTPSGRATSIRPATCATDTGSPSSGCCPTSPTGPGDGSCGTTSGSASWATTTPTSTCPGDSGSPTRSETASVQGRGMRRSYGGSVPAWDALSRGSWYSV